MQIPKTPFERYMQAELTALQITMLAFINTHPDKKNLLNTFDAVIANVQVQLVSQAGPVPDDLRAALQRFRDQVAYSETGD